MVLYHTYVFSIQICFLGAFLINILQLCRFSISYNSCSKTCSISVILTKKNLEAHKVSWIQALWITDTKAQTQTSSYKKTVKECRSNYLRKILEYICQYFKAYHYLFIQTNYWPQIHLKVVIQNWKKHGRKQLLFVQRFVIYLIGLLRHDSQII